MSIRYERWLPMFMIRVTTSYTMANKDNVQPNVIKLWKNKEIKLVPARFGPAWPDLSQSVYTHPQQQIMQLIFVVFYSLFIVGLCLYFLQWPDCTLLLTDKTLPTRLFGIPMLLPFPNPFYQFHLLNEYAIIPSLKWN